MEEQKNLNFAITRESLSGEDKFYIKQAVLKAVENGFSDPEMLASRCCSAIEIINKSGINTGIGSCGTTSTTVPE